MDIKTCTKCNQTKNINEFSKAKQTKDGLCWWCKSCMADSCRIYHYKHHPLKVKEQLEPGNKRCTACKEIKPIINFTKDNHAKDGLCYTCKKCVSKRTSKLCDYLVDLTLINKKCNKCNIEKTISEFYKMKNRKDGLHGTCKHCIYQFYQNNKESFLIKSKIARQNDPKKYAQSAIKWMKNAYKTNISYKINVIFATAIRRSLKGNKNFKHWEDLVGWTAEEMIKHIENQFLPYMSWSNYGWYINEQNTKQLGWEIDHISPLSNYNIKSYNDIEFKNCWSLSNLRPMWATTRTIDGITYLGNRNKSNTQ